MLDGSWPVCIQGDLLSHPIESKTEPGTSAGMHFVVYKEVPAMCGADAPTQIRTLTYLLIDRLQVPPSAGRSRMACIPLPINIAVLRRPI